MHHIRTPSRSLEGMLYPPQANLFEIALATAAKVAETIDVLERRSLRVRFYADRGCARTFRSELAAAVDDAGFCPVMRRPSTMAKLCQSAAFS